VECERGQGAPGNAVWIAVVLVDLHRLILPLVCAFSLLPLSWSPADADTVAPSDPNFRYVGRWDDTNTAAPWSFAKGSTIIASFEGTSVSVTLTTGNDAYFRVIIDNDASGSVKTQIPTGVPTALASGLADTVHTLELVKETDVDRLTFLQMDLDSGRALAAPPGPAKPPHRVLRRLKPRRIFPRK
jgi:hypothetical protein